jgi:2-dehydropantoate 2-reductase
MMTQVPLPHYLIIGNGRVAQHFRHYFSLLGLSFCTWHRGQSFTILANLLQQVTHALLLISDGAIDAFIAEHLMQPYHAKKPLLVHFSGSLISLYACGAHPLMTFSHHLYDLAHYQTIPFIIDDNAPSFNDLLPGLPNPHARLAVAFKPKYHALCVLAGNFSCLLWQKLMAEIKDKFNMPTEITHPFLIQQTQNLLTHLSSALTGPLTRNDKSTIEKNLIALEGDAFQSIYQAFVNCYQAEQASMHHTSSGSFL